MTALLSITNRARPLSIEHLRIRPASPSPVPLPPLIFLHEGLGSVSAWRDFPQKLCDALGAEGVAYSRPGYGKSTARRKDEKWGTDYMHVQAGEVLPSVMKGLGWDEGVKPWLVGHSDGASIALIYASLFPTRPAGLVAVAPHVFVEPESIAGIETARSTFLASPRFRDALARHHDDVNSAFWGWNEAWLAPDFRDWNLEGLLGNIECPVLVVQGSKDEYGTMAQVNGIKDRVKGKVEVVELVGCGHVPFREKPGEVVEAIKNFVTGSVTAGTGSGPAAGVSGQTL